MSKFVPSRSNWQAWFIIVGSLSLFIAGCNVTPNLKAENSLLAEGFVGNAACAGCHEPEFKQHRLTRHDLTLQPTTEEALGKLVPEAGIVPLAGYSISQSEKGLVLSRIHPKIEELSLDYVLGSGKTGMTYVSLQKDNTLLEAKASYFPLKKLWEITPGQELVLSGDTKFGRLVTTDEARKCLGCHVSAVPKDSLNIPRQLMGVGCEGCHGAGKDHIAAVKSGNTSDLKMQRLGDLSPTELNEACGKCHRSAKNMDTTSPDAQQTHRFQAYALSISKCRTPKGEPLSCLSCHNPHTNSETSIVHYTNVCSGCHSPSKPSSQSTSQKQTVCPVNPTKNCTECHMRPRPAFPLLNFPSTMRDHLISKPNS